jgi:transposase
VVIRRSSYEAEDGTKHIGSLAVIGVDIGKEVFHIVGLGVDGKMAFRRKIRRLGLKDGFEKLPPCIVGMGSVNRHG